MKRSDIHFTEDMMYNQESIELLYDYLNPLPETGRLLECGTGFGHFIKFFSELKPSWFCYTCDGFGLFGDGRIYSRLEHDKVSKIFDYLKDQHNVIQILGNTNTIPWELPLDVLILDSGHTFEACKADLDRYSPFLLPGGTLIFDDYEQEGNATNGVKQVVDELQGFELLHTGRMAIAKKSTN